MKRPEYVACIRNDEGSKDHQHTALCGRYIWMEFAFQGVEHAQLNKEQGGRLVTCPECEIAATQKVAA